MLALWSWTQSKRLFYMLWMLPPSWHLTQLWRLNNILQPHHFRFVSRWRCEERHSTLLLSTFTFVYTSFFFFLVWKVVENNSLLDFLIPRLMMKSSICTTSPRFAFSLQISYVMSIPSNILRIIRENQLSSYIKTKLAARWRYQNCNIEFSVKKVVKMKMNKVSTNFFIIWAFMKRYLA